MERLTTYSNGAYAYVGPGCKYRTRGEIAIEMDSESVKVVLKKLATYEETGLTPEEVVALQASNDALKKEAVPLLEEKINGRLVVMPCKVTDTVYILESVYKGRKIVGEQVVPAQIDCVIIGGTTGKPVYDLCSETGKWYKSMEPGDFYLTAEEAEKAMKEGAGRGV